MLLMIIVILKGKISSLDEYIFVSQCQNLHLDSIFYLCMCVGAYLYTYVFIDMSAILYVRSFVHTCVSLSILLMRKRQRVLRSGIRDSGITVLCGRAVESRHSCCHFQRKLAPLGAASALLQATGAMPLLRSYD